MYRERQKSSSRRVPHNYNTRSNPTEAPLTEDNNRPPPYAEAGELAPQTVSGERGGDNSGCSRAATVLPLSRGSSTPRSSRSIVHVLEEARKPFTFPRTRHEESDANGQHLDSLRRTSRSRAGWHSAPSCEPRDERRRPTPFERHQRLGV